MNFLAIVFLLWKFWVSVLLWFGLKTICRRPIFIAPLIYTEIAGAAMVLGVYYAIHAF